MLTHGNGSRCADHVTAIIADSDPMIRATVRSLVRPQYGIELAGECRTASEAMQAMQRCRPELLFLSCEFSDRLEPLISDAAVICLAADQHMHTHHVPLDCLLKPFDEARWLLALQRARTQIAYARERRATAELTAVLKSLRAKSPSERLVIKSPGHVYFLGLDEIDWIQAEGNYVRIYAGPQSYFLRERIGVLETTLDSRRFLRIHRSTIVNVDRIRELQPCNSGESMVILRNGKELSLSRGYGQALREQMKLALPTHAASDETKREKKPRHIAEDFDRLPQISPQDAPEPPFIEGL